MGKQRLQEANASVHCWAHQQKESDPHLPQVVKVVLVMNPAVIGRETVWFIGDVLHIQTHTVIELPFEELYTHTHTHTHTHSEISVWQSRTRDHCRLNMRLTWTPRMPKMMKKAQQMRTMFPMGFSDVIRVSTTSFRPGARLITLRNHEEPSHKHTEPHRTYRQSTSETQNGPKKIQ